MVTPSVHLPAKQTHSDLKNGLRILTCLDHIRASTGQPAKTVAYCPLVLSSLDSESQLHETYQTTSTDEDREMWLKEE